MSYLISEVYSTSEILCGTFLKADTSVWFSKRKKKTSSTIAISESFLSSFDPYT
jgi:hypothetical protein